MVRPTASDLVLTSEDLAEILAELGPSVPFGPFVPFALLPFGMTPELWEIAAQNNAQKYILQQVKRETAKGNAVVIQAVRNLEDEAFQRSGARKRLRSDEAKL